MQILSLLKHEDFYKSDSHYDGIEKMGNFHLLHVTLTAPYAHPKERRSKTCHPYLSKMAFKNLDMVTPLLDDNGKRPPRNTDLM